MISKEHAKQIALQHLASQNIPDGVVIIDPSTIEKPYGWVFFYDSKKFIETGDPDEQLFGNAPILVLRDGKIHFLSTAYPSRESLAMLEAEHGLVP